MACSLNLVKIVASLLESRAFLDATNVQGNTPLHIASGNGNTRIVKLLLGRKPELNIRNAKGRTALHQALVNFKEQEPRDEVVDLLIKRGAHVNIREANGASSISLASSVGYLWGVKKLLASNADPNQRDKDGYTALHHAVSTLTDLSVQGEIIDLLIKHGADANIGDQRGFSPVHTAAKLGNVQIIQNLLGNETDLL
ncbi:hypothetical protein CAPTEDRAFT_113182, partial [Capitella teleta]